MTIGFIGFGEAGYHIAKGLRGAGVSEVFAYDIAHKSADRGSTIERRAAEAGVTLTDTLEDLANRSEIVFSTVVSSVAADVAEQTARYLSARHFYVDLNSTSPAVKEKIAAAVAPSGARFVEAAVMAGVAPLGHKVPLLLCGQAVPDLITRLSPYEMCLEDFGRDIGRATAAKMFRSIVVKGLEALFLECVLASSRYGVAKRVLDSVSVGYPGIDWNKLAHYLIGRTALHGERRAHEMKEVADTLKAIGIEPIMAEATAKRLLKAAKSDLKSRFREKAPENYDDVIDVLREKE